jgi:hypothetical protein
MLRQRLRTRTSPLVLVGRVIVFLFACALVWYGAMLALLALGVDAGTIDQLSGYRTAFDELAALREDDLSTLARVLAVVGGLLAFVLFGRLAFKELPRPYFVRQDLELSADERGVVTVEPRAIERAAEGAALTHPAVAGVAARFATDDLAVDVTVGRGRGLSDTLEDVQRRVAEALKTHGLPAVPINLTLTGFERRTRRELD